MMMNSTLEASGYFSFFNAHKTLQHELRQKSTSSIPMTNRRWTDGHGMAAAAAISISNLWTTKSFEMAKKPLETSFLEIGHAVAIKVEGG